MKPRKCAGCDLPERIGAGRFKKRHRLKTMHVPGVVVELRRHASGNGMARRAPAYALLCKKCRTLARVHQTEHHTDE